MISKAALARSVVLALAASAALAAEAGGPALKNLVPRSLLIGAAVSQGQSDGKDEAGIAIVTREFDSISPENVLKWERVHPQPDSYVFEPADRYVAFGRDHGMAVIGHCLVWHQQTPRWVFEGKDGARADRDTALARMRDHILKVAGRYRGRIHGWDVVNEALEDDGTLRKTPWLAAIGEDYIAKAFEFAHEADPDAELYYNDYNLWKPAKRDAAVRIAKQLRERGLRIDAIGEQAHWGLEEPDLPAIDATLSAIEGAGFKSMLTEMDVDVLPRDPEQWGADLAKKAKIKAASNLYPNGLPPQKQEELAKRYADIFSLVLKHGTSVSRVTFWGVTDAGSWLNDFPIPGRVNYPLLWDREGKPKPAFDAVVKVLEGRPTDARPTVSLTFDDLPAHAALPPGMKRTDVARSVLAALQAHHAPPTYGFVNAKGLEEGPDAAEVLRLWRAAGYPLGNHTLSHMDLNANTAEAFERDILANEATLRTYMGDEGWRWLRFPYLREGDTPEKRQAVAAFLKDHGYRVAEVTLSFDDYAYNDPYARCVARNDTASIEWMKESYMRRADESLTTGREAARLAFGHDIGHVMLLHIGAFQTVMLPRLLDLLDQRGFRLVTLEEAEADAAYSSPPDAAPGSGKTPLERMAAARPGPPTTGDDLTRLSGLCR